MHCCDWSGYEENRQRIIAGVREGKRVCMPLAFMALSDDAHDARRCAEIFGAHRFPPAAQPLWRGERYRHRKTRVAFLSADFRMHPVGYLLIGMIEGLDRQQFESIGVSLGVRDGSDLYTRFRNAFDHYLDCHGKHSLEIATLMRAMEVDIVIDLSGYTAGSRIDILAHRPAPIQIGYLGFPGTLALPFVDYIIADRYTVPETLHSAYSERVLYLPHCYLPRDTSVMPARELPPRAHWGLPDDGVVFCSFNHDYKITPSLFDVWADLLRNTPRSVLWLMKLNEDAERNLLAAAVARDIDPKRLIFATRVPRIEDHLARLRHADVYLDTYPYNGHTTTSDVLLAGVNVVTMSGTSFASRVSGSLLNDHSLGGSVAENLDRYRARSLALAASAEELRPARLSIAKARPWPTDSAAQGAALGSLCRAIVCTG
jgi:predicted O-linked N-acetylglucosamine transferase (SPINDLY family)